VVGASDEIAAAPRGYHGEAAASGGDHSIAASASTLGVELHGAQPVHSRWIADGTLRGALHVKALFSVVGAGRSSAVPVGALSSSFLLTLPALAQPLENLELPHHVSRPHQMAANPARCHGALAGKNGFSSPYGV